MSSSSIPSLLGADYLPRRPNYVAVPVREATLIRDLADFVLDAPLNNMEESSRFVNRRPGVVQASDTILQSQYIDRAVQALAEGDEVSRRMAFTYMEKYSLIRLMKVNLDKDVPDLLYRKNPDMTRKFKQVFERVLSECESKATRAGRPTEQAETRHGGRPTAVERPSQVEGIAERLGGLQLHQQHFRSLLSREWNWFRPGRVIAIRVLEEYGDLYSLERVQTTRGTEVTAKVLRLVVVKCRAGFCLAVPIHTYGGKGLKKLGFREDNINAHARIHMSNVRPVWLPGEPTTPKRDIVVAPTDQHQVLHPASRICLERTTDVDYNRPILKIGTVTPETLSYLLAYWESETTRTSSHGRPRPQGSSGPVPGPRENRQLDTLQEEGRHTALPQAETRRTAQPTAGSRHNAPSQDWNRQSNERLERNRESDDRRQRTRQIDEREQMVRQRDESEESRRQTDQVVQRQERSRHTDSAKDKKRSNDRGRGGRG